MKKLLLSVLSVFFVVTCGLFIYKTTLKTEAPLYSTVLAKDASSAIAETTTTRSALLPEDIINTQIKEYSNNGTNIYFFYKKDNNNSIYMNDNILSPVITKESIASESIKYIDISALDDTCLPSTYKKNWGFESFPALVQATYNEDGTISVLSTLEWNNDVMLTDFDVKQWFISVDLIKQAVEDAGIPIDRPLE